MNRTALTPIVAAFVALAIPGSALAAPKVDGEFPVTNMPRHLTQGPDGNIWVAEGNIAKITPAGAVTEFSPADISGATGITTGPDGNLWVTQNGGVAKFSPANPNGALKFDIAALTNANKITTGPDGNLWTAAGKKVIKIPPANPTGATDKEITGMDARGIASSGGRLWVVDRSGKAIVSVTTDFNTITPHPVTAGPQEVAAGPNGQVAYTDPGQQPHQVGRLTRGRARSRAPPWAATPSGSRTPSRTAPTGGPSSPHSRWAA